MPNMEPSRDIRLTLSKAYLIKLWNSIIKQFNIEGQNQKVIIKKQQKKSGSTRVNSLTMRPLAQDWGKPIEKKYNKKAWRLIFNKSKVEENNFKK